MRLFLALLLVYKKVWSCGYDSCVKTNDDVLNVHIVPHTHNDVGWVKTVHQYYEDQVQKILNSVIKELWLNRHRRFMYVETAFFWRWWSEQDEGVKNKVRVLVKEGRLKFIGGAWTMNDEATTHYQSIIDQFTLGLRKLNETFGSCAIPKVAWQIDSFGHSREFASLLAAMGYDGVFLCHIDTQELQKRRARKTMEFIWRGDDNLGSSSDIFAGVLYDSYTPPKGFDFGWRHSNTILGPIKKKITEFFNFVKYMSKAYKTNNVLIPMGDDFAYTNAFKWFKNLDVLINMANMRATAEQLKVKLIYSTPDCYLKAVKNENPTLSMNLVDFFPYKSKKGYATGYYTSRPSLKYLERETNRYLQMIKQLYVLTGLDIDRYLINKLRSAMGIIQHHDGITGTEKQHVADDYKKILSQAVDNSLLAINKIFSKFAGSYLDEFLFKFEKCQLNQSECKTSETSQKFITTVYNPLAWEVFDVDVVVPVTKNKYIIYDLNGNVVDAQLVPIISWYINNIPERRSIATHELIFKVKSVAPLGFESFYIKRIDAFITESIITPIVPKTKNGALFISTIESGYYASSIKSGAYVSSSSSLEPVLWYHSTFRNIKSTGIKIYATPIIKKYMKKGNVNLYKIAWLCDPIPVHDNVGKEVVVRYNTDIKNNGIFYTDSNGRQMVKRFFNQDQTDIAKNYYPVPNKISILDNNARVTIITDRAEGGCSPKTGTIELMINRRLLYDDGLGVYEALDDNGSVNIINHHLLISNVTQNHSGINEKTLNFEINMSPVILFSDAKNLSLDRFFKIKQLNAGLRRNFPEGLHLLTLEPWANEKLLLRLENYFESSDDTCNTVEINLCNIFSTFTITSLRETSLAANQWIQENEKWTWNTNPDMTNSDNSSCKRKKQSYYGVHCSAIELYPQEIRTFIVDYRMIS